jgi:long-chain acyl-CoA synthetase
MPTREEALALLTGPGGPFEIAEADVFGQRLRVYRNAPASLRALWESSAARGDAPLLVYGTDRISYAEAHVQVRTVAAALAALGVGKGDRVAIGMRNYPEWVLAFWAVQSLGAVVVALNAWWTAAELLYGLTDSGTSVAIVDSERYERLAPDVLERLHLKGVIVTRSAADLPAGVQRWADVVAEPDPGTLPEVDIAPDDDATILYTSGTTGAPKGAVGSQRNHLTNVTNTILNGALAMLTGPAVDDPPAGAAAANPTVALWTFPFFHIAGVTGICVITATGGAIVTQYKWDPAEALELIERERVTVVAGVPTVVRQLLEHPDAARRDLSSISGISQGGSPVPPDSIARIESDFGGKVAPANGYGLTETTSAVIANSGTAYFAKKDSVGLPMPGTDVRIVDELGHDVAPGEVGEVWVRGPNNVRGYWNKPEATAQSFTDGWFHTGDAGRVDEDGFVYIVDRLKDMVLRGGENVYCAEVEAAIYEHPAIADVAVVGVPHPVLGEEVAAVVNLKEAATLDTDELRVFLSGRLAAFKIPSIVHVSDQEIPRNATGKVLKKDLRAVLTSPHGPRLDAQ